MEHAAAPDHLREAYDAIKARARVLAGKPGDIGPRVVVHHAIYLDSRGNHAFPLIALHGALWGYDFFETTGVLGEIIAQRYFYDPDERTKRHAMLDGFAEGFKAVNREVFIDTYTNYWFTKAHGQERGAEALVRAELLAALREVHAAAAGDLPLSPERQKHVFVQALRFEQEITVAPGIARELARFDCPILRALCLRPTVKFAYFQPWHRFFFRDFSDKDERIERAIRAFDIAADRGWAQVLAAMHGYRLPLPQAPTEKDTHR